MLAAWHKVGRLRTWVHGVIELSPFVHPDFGDTRRVVKHHILHSPGEGVGWFVSENVADVWTGDNLEDAAALPHLYTTRMETLIRLSTDCLPEVHVRFVASQNN